MVSANWFQRLWWRIRHRRSRAETVAFSMGVEVGRALCDMRRDEVEAIKNRVKDGYNE